MRPGLRSLIPAAVPTQAQPGQGGQGAGGGGVGRRRASRASVAGRQGGGQGAPPHSSRHLCMCGTSPARASRTLDRRTADRPPDGFSAALRCEQVPAGASRRQGGRRPCRRQQRRSTPHQHWRRGRCFPLASSVRPPSRRRASASRGWPSARSRRRRRRATGRPTSRRRPPRRRRQPATSSRCAAGWVRRLPRLKP